MMRNGATKNRAWHPKPKRDTSFALIQEQSDVSGGIKIASFLSGELDFFSIDNGAFHLINFQMTAVSLDLVNDPYAFQLFDLGNISVYAGVKNFLPYAGAMASVWSPTVTYRSGDTDFGLSLHLGAIGYEFVPGIQSGKVGFATHGIGFSFFWA
jgi:hypothetical protein